MGLFSWLVNTVDEILFGSPDEVPSAPYERRKWKRQERELKSMVEASRRGVTAKKRLKKTRAQKNKHAAYMRQWRGKHPGSGKS